MAAKKGKRPKLKARVNLASTWMSIQMSKGQIKAEIVRHFNKDEGTRYSQARFNDFISGRRQPDKATRDRMLRDVLWPVLRNEGVNLSRAALQRVLEKLL